MPRIKVNLNAIGNPMKRTTGPATPMGPQENLLETFQQMAEWSGKKSIAIAREKIEQEIHGALDKGEPKKREAH